MLHSFINGLYSFFFSCVFDLLLSVSERYQNTDDFIACQYLMQFKWNILVRKLGKWDEAGEHYSV